MINTQHNMITSFLKASLLTAVMVGSLVAQSYATNNLFSDTVMKMDIEFSSTEDVNQKPQVASMTVHNNQESSIVFGDHQINIKSTFIKWADEATEPEQIFAELKLLKLAQNGEVQSEHSPSLMLERNKWAEFKLAPKNNQEGIHFKMKYQEHQPASVDHSSLHNTEWLNWEGIKIEEEVC